MLVWPLFRAIDDFIDYIRADKRERRMMRLVPRTCRQCEVLGLCRDEENDWKCRNGCRFIAKDPLPPRCKKCEHLMNCRDESNGWKCRNGCIVINEERNQRLKQLQEEGQ